MRVKGKRENVQSEFLTKKQPDLIPEIFRPIISRVMGNEEFRSEYSGRAKDEIRGVEAANEAKQAGVELLKEIHRQVAGNFRLWESERHPGVAEVYSYVSVLEIIKKLGSEELRGLAATAGDDIEKDEWILFSSKPMQAILPPLNVFGADGSPVTAMDIAIEDLGKAINQVSRSLREGKPADVVWKLVGSPVGPGGKVTEEFVSDMEKGSYYKEFTDLHTEMLEQELGNSKVKKLILTGQSYGASMAVLTARKLEEEIGENDMKKAEVLADDPVVAYKGTGGGQKLILGSVLEAFEGLWQRRKDYAAKFWITNEYKRFLEIKGIKPDDDQEQTELKNRMQKVIDRDLNVGPQVTMGEDLYPDKIKVFIRQGAYDETQVGEKLVGKQEWETFKFKGTLAPFRHEKHNVRVYGYGSGHAMDRFRRIDRFVKAADLLRNV